MKIQILKSETPKYNEHKNKLLQVWKNLRSRCNNPNHPKYNRYGGRGIVCCEEWNKFYNFYIWAINNGYEPGLTLDRIDSNDNYKPNNCRWVNYYVQENNKENNIFLEYNNKIYTLKQLSKLLNIPRNKLSKCFHNGSLFNYNIKISSYTNYINQNDNTL